MTLSIFDFQPPRTLECLDAPPPIGVHEISVIVPVKDDQFGIDRLLATFSSFPHSSKPRRVVVVDNRSRPRIRLPALEDLHVTLTECDTPGPAAARNVGWRSTDTPWVLFMDADCIPTLNLLPRFISAANGAVAYAGNVCALRAGGVSEYYDAQKTLVPPPTVHQRPVYLVTANALVYRPALETVGGFRETFDIAGGEDIDLAVRLRSIGELSYATEAVVLHDFENDLGSFWRRFVRYGRGNRLLESLHDVKLRPQPFIPARRTPSHFALSALQFAAMTVGYLRTQPV